MALRFAGQFALSFHPYREKRLLAFTNGNTGGTAVEDEEDENEENEEAENENEEAENTTEDAVDTDEHNEQIESVLSRETDAFQKSVDDIHRIQKKLGDMQGMVNRMQRFITQNVPPQQQEEHMTALKETRTNLRDMQSGADLLAARAEALAAWENGDTSPQTFQTWLFDEELDEADDDFAADRATFSIILNDPQYQATTQNWLGSSDEAKQQVITAINSRVDIVGEAYSDMRQRIGGADSAIRDWEIYYDKLQKAKNDGEEKPSRGRRIRFTIQRAEVMWDAGKQVWEAFQKSWEEGTSLKSNRFAKYIAEKAAWIPFVGERTKQLVDEAVAGKEDDIKDNYLKLLERQRIPFHQIRPYLQQNRRDPNRFRAVLEYMAKRAWLYDFNPEANLFYGFRLESGVNVPTWNEQQVAEYSRELQQMNSSGQEEEKKNGKARVNNMQEIEPMGAVLKDELMRGNYWRSYGILERALEKGKLPEVSTWITNIIHNHIRNDPTARKYFPIELLDQLGNIGIVHTAVTGSFLKFMRLDLEAWREAGMDMNTYDEIDGLPKINRQLRDHIEQAVGHVPESRLETYIAKIMAADTVTVRGSKGSVAISIFEDQYKWYRKMFMNFRGNMNVSGSDPDFFANRTEVMLLGSDGFKTIMRESNGQFPQNTEAQAKLYMEQTFQMYDELYKLPPGNGQSEAFKNYKAEVSKRVHNYFIGPMNDSRTSKMANNYTIIGVEEDGAIGDAGENIVFGLLRRGLLKWETVTGVLKPGSGKALAEEINRNLINMGGRVNWTEFGETAPVPWDNN